MYETTLEWKQGEAFAATTPSGHSLTFDGETQAGPSPVEVLLPALGACAGIDIVVILRKKRQELKGLRVTVSGERAGTPPRYWKEMKVHFIVTGDVSEKAMEHALELASTKYCSVAATINKTTALEWTYAIET